MESPINFDSLLTACLDRLTPAEQRVAGFFQTHREEVLISSAAALANQIGTSDATVVRTAKALGFAGMEALRRALARELRKDLSPAGRMSRTLGEVGDDVGAAFGLTLAIHARSLENLHRDITPDHFRKAVRSVVGARRIFIFGIGPSSAMAEYFVAQLGRLGFDAFSLTQAGLLLADGARRLGAGDLLMVFAYGRVYREVTVLLDRADQVGAAKILFSDTLGLKLGKRVDLVLRVARGRADMLSMHTTTLALIEALLVGVAADRPKEAIASLEALNGLRAALAGRSMNLPDASG
ncbi:MAG: MurR/RpiR family transcriptional regulator [Alphaproteobacteria bacterium]